jgi:cytochrome c-type biogenesis protein CcmE
MTTGKKLLIGGLVVGGVTAYMAYVGASASWQYYLTADECVANAPALVGQRIRVSGRVAPGTLDVAPDRRQASFMLQGTKERLRIRCPGPLPDNLAENIDVVVEGRLDEAGGLQGVKVLTRCASKYQSRAGDTSPETATHTAAGGGP